MAHDPWAALSTPYVEASESSIKGYVRSSVAHAQLLRHLPEPPSDILDVGGGAAHQSLPLARLGYDVTIVDSSPSMLTKAQQRLDTEAEDVRQRMRLIEGAGEQVDTVVGGQRFAVVLCHGVLMYLEAPEPLVSALVRSTQPGAMLSISALNAHALAVRPAVERRWADALAAFDATHEVGVLGTDTRADTVEYLSELLSHNGARTEAWYGTWLFTDWLDLQPDDTDLDALAAVELKASMRDPYRGLSRAFHLIGRVPGP